MADSRKEALNNVLKGLMQEADIDGAAVITRDGLLISGQLPPGVDGETFAAMAATMAGAAETAFAELRQGSIERVIVEGPDSKLIGAGAGENAVLVCLVKGAGNLGLALVEMKNASKEAAKLLK